MCNPLAVAAIAAVGSAAKISATNKAAEGAQEAAVNKQSAMNIQRMQEMEDVSKKTGMDLTNLKRESLRQQASARVAASESGVSGASTLRNLGNVYMQESFNAGSIVSLSESQVQQIGVQSQADFLSTRGAINQAESQKTTGAAAALQIGVAAATAYATAGGFTGGTAAIPATSTTALVPAKSAWEASKTTFMNNYSFLNL